jgi:hypothetical protein
VTAEEHFHRLDDRITYRYRASPRPLALIIASGVRGPAPVAIDAPS